MSADTLEMVATPLGNARDYIGVVVMRSPSCPVLVVALKDRVSGPIGVFVRLKGHILGLLTTGISGHAIPCRELSRLHDDPFESIAIAA